MIRIDQSCNIHAYAYFFEKLNQNHTRAYDKFASKAHMNG